MTTCYECGSPIKGSLLIWGDEICEHCEFFECLKTSLGHDLQRFGFILDEEAALERLREKLTGKETAHADAS